MVVADEKDPFGRQYKKQKKRTRLIAISGLLTALILITLFIAGLSPTAKIGLYSLSSVLIAIMIYEFGVRQGFLLYLTASIISIAWPGLAYAWPFMVFFGLFPVWRAFAERCFKFKTAWIMKMAGANLMIWPMALLFGQPLFEVFIQRFGGIFMVVLVFASQMLILLYHWGLTLLMRFYQLRLGHLLK